MKTYTPSYIRRNFILHTVLTVITGGIWWVVALPYWLLFKSNSRLTIDEDTVRYQTGILSKNVREIDVSDVRSVKVNQGFWDRIWGIGDIEISSASGFDDQIIVRGVGSPEGVRNTLRGARKWKEDK